MAKKKQEDAPKRKVETKIKNSELVDKRRKQIIDGALKVFVKKGFHATSVKEIADETGLTEGTLYNYVRSKQDIIYFIFYHVTKKLQEKTYLGISDIEDPDKRLRTALRQNLETIDELKDGIKFLYRESASLDREALHEILGIETKYIESFEKLVKDYFEYKEITVSEERIKMTADLLSYVPIIVAFRRWSLESRYESIDVAVQEILDFILRGIGGG